MAIYSLETKRETLHGTLDKHIPPVLTIQSGDTVVFRTLEGDWRWDKPRCPRRAAGARSWSAACPATAATRFAARSTSKAPGLG